jgi:SAM-dependent methyltransferase
MENPSYIHTSDIHNLKAPSRVLPLIFQWLAPTSVLDVGCGTGTWLKVACDLGAHEIYGLDADYVTPDKLHIPENTFRATDLSKEFDLDKSFDLVLSLEVAEHLPEDAAETFIESLCKHAGVILFSAAIPGQGGQNHLNEQWPAYWHSHFKKYGFDMYDLIRPYFWEDEEVDWWYRQNMFIVSKPDHPLVANHLPCARSYVHPVLFTNIKSVL